MGLVNSYSYGQPFGGHIPGGTSGLFIGLAPHASLPGCSPRSFCKVSVGRR